MSDFISLGFEEEKDFSDLGFEPEQSPVQEAPDISKMQSFQKGLEQGTTLGTADELSGGIGSALDKTQSVLSNITGGIIPKSPSQVNEELKQQGFGGNLPSSLSETYQQYRDAARKEYKQAEEANPMSFLGGDVTGSLIAPGAAVGNLAKGMSGIRKVGTLAGIGALLAGTEGAGRSEAQGTELASDIGLSAGIGAAVPLAGAVIGKTAGLAKNAIPSDMRDAISLAYQKGKQGIDVSTPEFLTESFNKLRGKAEELGGMVSGKQAAIAEEMSTAKKGVQKSLDKSRQITDKNLADIELKTQEHIDNLKASQIEQNSQLKKKLEKDSVKTSKNLQNDLEGVRKNLGNEYNKIDDMAKTAGVQVDSTPVLNEFFDSLAGTDLTESQINSIRKKFQPEVGLIDFKQFQDLKRKMYDLSSPAESPRLRFLAKKAYGGLGSSYEQTLRSNNLNEIADKLSDTNKKWSVYSNMDEYIEGVAPDRITKETYASPTTIKTVKNLSSDKAEDIAKMERFKEYNKMLFPENNLVEAEQLSSQMKKAQEFTPQIPDRNVLLTNNPDYQQVQQTQDVIKGTKIKDLVTDSPEVNSIISTIETTQGKQAADEAKMLISKLQPNEVSDVLKQFGSSPENVNKKVLNLLAKNDEQLASPVAKKELQDLFKFVGKEKGSEFSAQAEKQAQSLASDYDLANIINKKGNNVPSSIKGVVGNVVRNASGGIAEQANKIGRNIGEYQDLLSKFQKIGVSRPNYTTAIRAGSSFADDNKKTSEQLVAAPREEIQKVSQVVRSKNNPSANKLADTLDRISEKDNQQRNALTFGLMQDPNNRRMLNNLNETDEDVEVENEE